MVACLSTKVSSLKFNGLALCFLIGNLNEKMSDPQNKTICKRKFVNPGKLRTSKICIYMVVPTSVYTQD